jgi:hypothetical protein
MTKWAAAALLVGLIGLAAPQRADAFCGFYVGGGSADLFANATQAAMMREGNRTVMSIQNNYQGPTEDFAMVVPVPVVLQETDVKTLPQDLFDKMDRLTAPRLVEYWEQDPCASPPMYEDSPTAGGGGTRDDVDTGGVTVEAEFKVGEYEVVILSATESTGLETWLNDNQYNIPQNAAPFLDPYVQNGSKFFVAKVDPNEVTFQNGQAVLSPLRFHYDTPEFKIPIRLGLINSGGRQDLIVYTLGQNQRYEVANYDNVTIPTNIEVVDDVRHDFATFYRRLFQETVNQNPNAVVTEYSWDASTCDPCPGPTLDANDYMTLGADVLPGQPTWNWTITRLHARYEKNDIGADLVFREAPPIVGGRERYDASGNLETGSEQGTVNNFQGRYIIRHHWTGPVMCQDPTFGRWGGPPGEEGGPSISTNPSPNTDGGQEQSPGSLDDSQLEELVIDAIPELGVTPAPRERSDAACTVRGVHGAIPAGFAVVLGLFGLAVIRRRRD